LSYGSAFEFYSILVLVERKLPFTYIQGSFDAPRFAHGRKDLLSRWLHQL